MLRIRGTVGPWPVDLTLELDDEDWAKLGSQLASATPDAEPMSVPVADARPVSQDDKTWHAALGLLQDAGQLTGPELLSQLEALTGSTSAGKRLLVRLRHSVRVKVVSGAQAPLYSWVE